MSYKKFRSDGILPFEQIDLAVVNARVKHGVGNKHIPHLLRSTASIAFIPYRNHLQLTIKLYFVRKNSSRVFTSFAVYFIKFSSY